MSIYQLSKDYGLSTSTIHKRAKRGEWEKERERTAKEARKKTIEKAAKAAADNATIAANIRRKGLVILDRLYDQFMEMDCTEQRTSVDGVTKAMRLKDLTAAYKDLTGDMVTAEAQSNPLLQSLYELEKRLDHD